MIWGSKETKTDDTLWDPGIRPHTGKHDNKNTLMKLFGGHPGFIEISSGKILID